MTRSAKFLHLAALTAASAILLALGSGASAQSAQRNCGPRDVVIERLASGYGEERQSVGLGTGNRMVEVFASPETGSWTILITHPSGLSCLVAAGQSFQATAQSDTPRGDPA